MVGKFEDLYIQASTSTRLLRACAFAASNKTSCLARLRSEELAEKDRRRFAQTIEKINREVLLPSLEAAHLRTLPESKINRSQQSDIARPPGQVLSRELKLRMNECRP